MAKKVVRLEKSIHNDGEGFRWMLLVHGEISGALSGSAPTQVLADKEYNIALKAVEGAIADISK